MVSHILSDAEKAQIETAVQEAERQTSGQIVTAITRQSDHYTAAAIGFSAALAFILAWDVHSFRPDYGVDTLAAIQLGAFLVAFAFMELTDLMSRIVPSSYRHKAAHRLAREQFFANALHATTDRAGILILVSLNERCVQLLADKGIDAKETPATWKAITDALTADMRKVSRGQAITNAVDACAVVLARHFPANASRNNELPDDVIILP